MPRGTLISSILRGLVVGMETLQQCTTLQTMLDNVQTLVARRVRLLSAELSIVTPLIRPACLTKTPLVFTVLQSNRPESPDDSSTSHAESGC